MTLHQIIVDCSISPAFRYRDVSCFCGQLATSCSCDELKLFSFDNAVTETVKTTDVVEESGVQEYCVEDMPNQAVQTVTPVHELDATSVGKFCIITYDGKLVNLIQERFCQLMKM